MTVSGANPSMMYRLTSFSISLWVSGRANPACAQSMRLEIIGSVRDAAAISAHVIGAGALGSSPGAAFSS